MRSLALHSILVASDLEDSYDVLRAAASIAQSTGAELHVVHALDGVPHTARPAAQPGTSQALIDDAEWALAERVRRAVPSGVALSSLRVMDQPSHRAILTRADEVAADRVVLGPPRRRRVGDWLLGGTADRVVRDGAVPCLVVRRPLTLPLRRIVAPLNLAEPVAGALDAALAWSAAFAAGSDGFTGCGTEVRVLHVLPLDRAAALPDFHRVIEGAVERVPAASALQIRQEWLWGEEPAAEIVAFADCEDTELVVLSPHGYGPTKRALLGSVSSAVTCAGNCSVLLVPPSLWQVAPVAEEQALYGAHAAQGVG